MRERVNTFVLIAGVFALFLLVGFVAGHYSAGVLIAVLCLGATPVAMLAVDVLKDYRGWDNMTAGVVFWLYFAPAVAGFICGGLFGFVRKAMRGPD